MRITSGLLRGRTLKSPPGDTRPTQDKVRQAIFSALGDFTDGARVLDLFAGSGALGLEAWSRGAAAVVWVEEDRRALTVLKENLCQLCPGAGAKTRCIGTDVFKFLEAWPKHEPAVVFDLVLADPPYDRFGEYRRLEKTLPALEAGPILRPGGFLVFEFGAREEPVVRAGWTLIWDRTYGGTRVVMYRRDDGHEEKTK
ncbi:MAG: 16S rRNA (guanine(966)-N(2))-methyltransferase RsmD [Verrucomicrobia bacterium]|nr:MAG: 16S rRNA (guanine(966)-N(2))-methyltransferase RsmD [Verrucomicrobiota bacterium]